jgi:hypothetical protein
MLDTAKERGLFEEETNFPIIPELVPVFSKASAHFKNVAESQGQRLLETMVHHSCLYLWAKAVEGAFRWADSPDGNVTIDFQPGDLAAETLRTGLSADRDSAVNQSKLEGEVYFKAHQQAMLMNQHRMGPEQMEREIAVTLEYFPRFAMAYAIKKGYHRN